jgi:hypothetical protein
MNTRQPLWPLGLVALVAAAGCGVKRHPIAPSVSPVSDPNEPGEPTGSGGSPAGTGGTSGKGGESALPSGSGKGGDGGRNGDGDARGGSADASGAGGRPAASDAAPSRPEAAPANPGPASPGPTIGGLAVPKEKAIVLLHVGHSDMAGRADGPASLRPFVTDTDPHLWVYQKGGTFRPAREPTAGDADSAGKAGPGMALLRTALARAPDVYVISIGHGHSGASGGYCPNFRKGMPLWNLFMDAAIELKGKVTFGGLFTMFGITEYHLGTAGLNKLADCLTGLASEVRQALDAPDMPLMVGDWNMGGSGIYDPGSMYAVIARPQIQMVPGKDPRAAVIPTDGLPMQDDRHLNYQGHKTWAERAFQIMADKGWLPWAR